MFVGHYGASFVAKRYEPGLPLWLLFLAVQLLDVVWAPLVLLGIEKVRIVPGITRSNPLDLYYMPAAVFGVAMLAIHAQMFFGSPPASPSATAVSALAAYCGFALVIHFVEKRSAERRPQSAAAS